MLRNYIYNNNRYIKKIPTLCTTTDNITLSGTGQTIDGVTTTTNDVVLVKDQIFLQNDEITWKLLVPLIQTADTIDQ